MSYDWLRELADSWVLVAMFAFYLICIGWAFRPGGKRANKRAKHSIFEKDRADD